MFVVLPACAQRQTVHHTHASTVLAAEAAPHNTLVPIMPMAEVRRRMAAGEPLVLTDARLPEAYAQSHIPGAYSIPLSMAQAWATREEAEAGLKAMTQGQWQRGKVLVAYCGGGGCPVSTHLVEKLLSLGITNLYDMPEGIAGWQAQP